MKDRSDDPSHPERTLLLRSYISVPTASHNTNLVCCVLRFEFKCLVGAGDRNQRLAVFCDLCVCVTYIKIARYVCHLRNRYLRENIVICQMSRRLTYKLLLHMVSKVKKKKKKKKKRKKRKKERKEKKIHTHTHTYTSCGALVKISQWV